MSKTAKKIVFSGRVQGVGFRYTTHRLAGGYDLTGYVKNNPDGTVEALFQGNGSDIDSVVKDIKQNFDSNISQVRVTETAYDHKYDKFIITR